MLTKKPILLAPFSARGALSFDFGSLNEPPNLSLLLSMALSIFLNPWKLCLGPRPWTILPYGGFILSLSNRDKKKLRHLRYEDIFDS